MRPLISFDAAGTLIHVREPVGQTYAAFARLHGISVDVAALKTAFRSVWTRMPAKEWPEGEKSPDDDRGWWYELVDQVFAEVLGKKLDAPVLDPLFTALYNHFALPEAWSVYGDVIPSLQDLSRDHALCVLSNFDRRLPGILAGHGLGDYFQQIILSSEVGASKPHRRMFDTALRLMAAEPASSIHVGDDAVCDIAGAEACGWSTFAVARPGAGLDSLIKKVRSGEIPACRRAVMQ